MMKIFSFLMILFFTLGLTNSCKKDKTDNSGLILGLAALASRSSTTSVSTGALIAVPGVLTGSTTSASIQSSDSISSPVGKAVVNSTAATSIQGIYDIVRAAIKVSSAYSTFATTIITFLQSTTFTGTIEGTDTGDANRKKIYKIASSSTFGAGGKKVESWWKNTGSDSLRDGNKNFEIDYTQDSAGNIDGVIFIRQLNTTDTYSASSNACNSARTTCTYTSITNAPTIRFEFKRSSNSKIVVMQIQNIGRITDATKTDGKAAFYLKEIPGTNTVITVDGSYFTTGIQVPFLNNNTTDTTNWGTTTTRSYIFTAAAIGTDSSAKGVVSVILPKTGDETSSTTPYANSTSSSKVNWSLGELYTQGLAYYLINTATSSCGSYTTLATCFNGAYSTSFPTSNSAVTNYGQILANTDLSTLSSKLTSSSQDLINVQTVVGLVNPVYFLKSSATSTGTLIGQQDTTGLSAVANVGDVTQYTTIQNQLRTTIRSCSTDDGGSFNSTAMSVMDIVAGTSICAISGHPTSTASWSGATTAIPTTGITVVSTVQ